MSWLCNLVLALAAAGGSTALPTLNDTVRADYTGHSIVSIVPKTAEQARALLRLGNEMQLDFWVEPKQPGSPAVVRVAPQNLLNFTKELSIAGMEVKTEVENVQKIIDNERHQARFSSYSDAPELFQRYLTNEEFEDALRSYSEKYDHVNYTSIGKSFEGRDIIGVHITGGNNRPIVFLECGIHAREWIAHATCLYFIDQLATMYEKDESIKRLVDDYEWRIFPVVNPDGYAYTHTHHRLWRKTRSVSKSSSECIGADGNRNFDAGPICGDGASQEPCWDNYCGDSPFSEPETRAVRDAVMAVQGRISFYFSVHSYGQLWMFPYAYKKQNASNYEELFNISVRGTEAIRKLYGTEYSIGPTHSTVGRLTGSSVDWAYEKAGVKRSFVLELPPDHFLAQQFSNGFLLPPKNILRTAEETWAGVRAAIEYSSAR